MTGWIIWGVYAVGYVACWRTLCWFFVTDLSFSDEVDGEALVTGVVIGSAICLFWPFIAVGIGAKYAYKCRGESITMLVVPRSQKRKLELDERERRIRELEYEVGIR